MSLRKFESDRDRVGNLASVFLRKHSARHVGCAGLGQIESAHDPGDLVNHVLGAVPAREFPEQPPVDQFVWIKRPVGTPIEKRLPVHILLGAVGRNRAHPLPMAVRRVASHPGFHLSHLAYPAILDPLPRVGERARTLVLQPDLHNLARRLGRSQAAVCFGDGPGHRLLGVKIFSRG